MAAPSPSARAGHRPAGPARPVAADHARAGLADVASPSAPTRAPADSPARRPSGGAPDPQPTEWWKRVAVAGALVIAVGGTAATVTGPPLAEPADSGSSSASFEAGEPDPAALRTWYDSTLDARVGIATTAAAIRAYISAQDGLSLQPACVSLGEQVTAARALVDAPDVIARNLFEVGLDGYATAASACGHIFDGSTNLPPQELQRQTTAGLTAGDVQWAELATEFGFPPTTPDPVPAATPPPPPPPATAPP
ncbi:MAG: hypothetical protein IRZ08_06570, partial [Frankia sp.]|nr:hypothetical protein [Frankia sp.]